MVSNTLICVLESDAIYESTESVATKNVDELKSFKWLTKAQNKQ
jgi:hypothetical protein